MECLVRGRSEVPAPVFCSKAGTPLDNLSRVWDRLRRRAQAEEGIRPLPLHSARHTWATHALDSGKSIRWVADQLGHADPALTLRVYAHVLRDDEVDLSFADFAGANTGSKRLYPAPTFEDDAGESRNYLKTLAPPAGIEPATRGLGNRRSIL